MSQTQYCNRSDVYSLGFATPGLLQIPARSVAAVSVTSNTITLQGHGCAADDPISFRADAGGSLPAPIATSTVYYAIVLSDSLLQVASEPGGAALDLTSAGFNVVAVCDIPWGRFIEDCSAATEQTVIAHTLPLLNPDDSIPIPVREYTALQVTIRALAFCGRETSALQQLLPMYTDRANKWVRGVPLRGVQTPVRTNLAITRSAARVDPRGFERGTGRLP